MNLKAVLVAATLGGGLFFAGAEPAEARHDRNCRAKISREESRLYRDIRRHGPYSRQAQRRRAALSRLYRQCGVRGRDHRWGRRDRRHDRRHRRGLGGVLRDRGIQHRRGAVRHDGVIDLPNGGAVVLPAAASAR
jgi:hypothetical protein